MNAKERLHKCQEELKAEKARRAEANKEIMRMHELVKARDRKAKAGADQCERIVHSVFADFCDRFGEPVADGYKEIKLQMHSIQDLTDNFEVLAARDEVGILTVRCRRKREDLTPMPATQQAKEPTGEEAGNGEA